MFIYKQPAILDWPVKTERKQDCTNVGHDQLNLFKIIYTTDQSIIAVDFECYILGLYFSCIS